MNISKIRLAVIGLLLALMTTNIGSMFAAPTAFSDVPTNHWAYEQINEMAEEGIVGGYHDGTFHPASSVSYGAFSLMLARTFYTSDLDAYIQANNVPVSTEVGGTIVALHGVLNGTRMASGNNYLYHMLTRDDMALMMRNVLVDVNTPLPSDTDIVSSRNSMSDFSNISNAAQPAVATCYSLGLLGGRKDGTFGPLDEMTRAQAAVVLSRLRTYVRENGGEASSMEITVQETPVEKPVTPVTATPTVTNLPAFRLEYGENVQQMMTRINKATPGYTVGYLVNGKPITDENIQEILDSAKESMPEDTPWAKGEFYYYNSPKLEYAGACLSFACGLSDYIFGEDAPVTKHKNFDQLKVGDIVWMKNSATGYNHAYVVTSLTNPYWGDDSYSICDGNRNGKISWDGTGRYSTFDKPEVVSGTWIYSRY